jgi:hypothetical protein
MASFIWSSFAIGLVSRTRSSIRGENKVVPVHSMKTYSGNEGTAPRFRTLGSRRRSLAGLTSTSSPRCLQNRGLGAFTNKTGGPHVQAVLSTVPTEQGAGCVYKQDWWASRPARLAHGAYRTGGWVRLQTRLVGLTSRPSCPRCLQNRGLGAFTNKTEKVEEKGP